jgi:hypothetical protein
MRVTLLLISLFLNCLVASEESFIREYTYEAQYYCILSEQVGQFSMIS